LDIEPVDRKVRTLYVMQGYTAVFFISILYMAMSVAEVIQCQCKVFNNLPVQIKSHFENLWNFKKILKNLSHWTFFIQFGGILLLNSI